MSVRDSQAGSVSLFDPSLSDVAVIRIWPSRLPDSRRAYTTAEAVLPSRAAASSFGAQTDQPAVRAEADRR
jgi:hypothetical protein